jgi:hypothetical protein
VFLPSAIDTNGQRRRRLPLAVVVLVALLSLGSAGAARSGSSTPPPRRPAHIAVVVLENTEYGSIVGSRNAPYLNSLIRRGGLATRFYGTTHPSLPNYLALLGGSTFGVDSNCDDCKLANTNLIDQLENRGFTWKAYMDGAPSACFKGASHGSYTRHHNPFVYFTDIADDSGRCSRIVPLTQLGKDIRAKAVPSFVWITPDECHDMHSCSVRTADRFLAGLLPRLLASLGRNGVLFVTWDEGDSDAGCCTYARGGHIATIVAGGRARRAARLRAASDHYSLLRTFEQLWRLPLLRHAGCGCTRSLMPLLAR